MGALPSNVISKSCLTTKLTDSLLLQDLGFAKALQIGVHNTLQSFEFSTHWAEVNDTSPTGDYKLAAVLH